MNKNLSKTTTKKPYPAKNGKQTNIRQQYIKNKYLFDYFSGKIESTKYYHHSVRISAQKLSAKYLPRQKLKKYYLPQHCLDNFFASVIKQIFVFALVIPSAVFRSYFGNVFLFNLPL